MFCMFGLMCSIAYDILIKNLRAYQASDTSREDSYGVVDETRPRGRRFHTVSRQKLIRTYQFGELRVN